ncbi:MAG: hypothetical protein WA210_21535 [Burkholderiaceae bacterium]
MNPSAAPGLRCVLPAALCILALVCPAWAQQDQPPAQALPSLAQLEAAGATIGEITVRVRNIFDTDDPNEDKLAFRWANALHIQTRVGVIERALLFQRGEPLSVRLIDETERVLRMARYLYDVQIRAVAYRDGIVDLEVQTRDTWTLDPGLSAGRTGGANTSGISLKEFNLLGSGIALSYGRSNSVDRSSNEFQISNSRAFGGWTSLSYSRAHNSDGQREAATVAHPFYALDTPWAAGVTVSKDNRIDSIYNAGKIASQYRHRQDQAEVFGGWSRGRIDGWVRRYSIGLTHSDDRFALEPGHTPPARLPPDEKLVAPFLRYEVIEDRFEKLQNRNQIGRPEFFALGWASTFQLGQATTALGSSSDAWLYSGSLSRGFEPAAQHIMLASLSMAGQYSGGGARRQRVAGQAQYFLPQSPDWLFYAAATGDMLTRPDPADSLLLGGDNGLRGYPLRYQSGTRRALLTLEERAYTDVYVWRLFRLGGAAYVDAGRAWGGDNMNTVNPGWLSNVGIGLRIFSDRAAFSHVLHIDLAFPLEIDANEKKLQFLIKTRTSF